MLIGINGSFLRKKDSGIGQVSWNFLKTLIKIHKSINDIHFIIYLEEDVDLSLPKGFEKKVVLTPYKRDDLLRKILWEKIALPQEAIKDKCDVFFSLYQSTSIISGIPHLMLVHDAVWKVFPQYLNNLRKKIYYFFVEKAILRANKVLTVSEYSKKDIAKFLGVAKRKISVAYIDCNPVFKQEVGVPDGGENVLRKYELSDDYIFYIGGFDVRKNVVRLVEAYGDFWKKYNKEIEIPDLVLAGSFYENLIPLVDDVPAVIKKTSKKFGVPEEKVKMVGFVDQDDLPTIYSNAKMLCYPSLYEGFGIPILEAMNIGCPVITSNVSSIPEIANPQNAFIVNPERVSEISDAIYEVLMDKKKVKEKVVQAQKDSRNFSWDKFIQEVLGEISSINS